jgi:hypothetical protein
MDDDLPNGQQRSTAAPVLQKKTMSDDDPWAKPKAQ